MNKKSNPAEVKIHKLSVRVTNEEKEKLLNEASEHQLKLSDYIRMKLLK